MESSNNLRDNNYMFAIIQAGGKQYKVGKDSIIKVEKMAGEPGSKVEFNQVLMLGEASKPCYIGTPTVIGALVTAEITGQLKDHKILIFKKKRRQNYRRMRGHRQELTELKILDITKL